MFSKEKFAALLPTGVSKQGAPLPRGQCCTPTSDNASRQRLRSASRYQLIVPHRRSKLRRRAFSVVGPMILNSLPDILRDPTISDDNFRAALKTHFSPSIRTCSALEASCVIALYKHYYLLLLTHILKCEGAAVASIRLV